MGHRKTNAHYHAHVNVFEDDISEDETNFLKQHGFKLVPYRILSETWSPVWIITTKRTEYQDALNLFKTVLIRLRETKLKGYVELERMLHSNVFKIPEGAWNANVLPFPLLARPDFVQAPRGADIHIFRKHSEPDGLDQLLSSLGFYPVKNEQQQIWTLLAEDMEDAQRLFDDLRGYFTLAHGVVKVEVEEIIEKLESIQEEFPFRPVARRGFYNGK